MWRKRPGKKRLRTCSVTVMKRRKRKEGRHTVSFWWIADIELTEGNLEEMTGAARGRWKIENGGFNNQKDGIYDIEQWITF